MTSNLNPRVPEAQVAPMFVERWSTRAFDPTPLPEEQIQSLFEAARWAPSCFNEQPWHFVYASEGAGRERLLSLLNDWNRGWAQHAPVIAFVAARRSFKKNSKPNRWAAFDTGAAWMALALEARSLGLYTHAMGGVDFEQAYKTLDLDPEHYDVLCAVAIGRRGDPSELSSELQEIDQPNQRQSQQDFTRRITE